MNYINNVDWTKLLLLLSEAKNTTESVETKALLEEVKDELFSQMRNLQENKKLLNDVWNNL